MNPYHDEHGRFASGPGAGQVGKGDIVRHSGGRLARVEGQSGNRLLVSGPTTDRFGKPGYGGMIRKIDPSKIESVVASKLPSPSLARLQERAAVNELKASWAAKRLSNR